MIKDCIKCLITLQRDEQLQLFCCKCGVVYETTSIDISKDKSTELVDKSDTRSDLAISESTYSTEISYLNKDFSGRRINPSFKKLKTWNLKIKNNDSYNKSIQNASVEIDRLVNLLGLSKGLKTQILKIYRKFLDTEFSKGKTLSGLLCAIIYMQAKKLKLPLSLDQITTFAKVRKRRITKLYKQLLLKEDKKLPRVNINNYIERYTHMVQCDQTESTQLLEISNNLLQIFKSQLVYNNTNTFASALVFLSQVIFYKEHFVSIKDYSQRVKITDVTLKIKLEQCLSSLVFKKLYKSQIKIDVNSYN